MMLRCFAMLGLALQREACSSSPFQRFNRCFPPKTEPCDTFVATRLRAFGAPLERRGFLQFASAIYSVHCCYRACSPCSTRACVDKSVPRAQSLGLGRGKGVPG